MAIKIVVLPWPDLPDIRDICLSNVNSAVANFLKFLSISFINILLINDLVKYEKSIYLQGFGYKMFKVVTKHTGRFKSLFEVIFQNMTTADFTIDKTGMFLEHLTTQNLLISVFLPADNFDEYIFDEEEPLHIGLGQHINKEFFKSVKNKDIITMSITKPNTFEFEKSSDEDSVQSLSVKIQDTQNIYPIEHETFKSKPVLIAHNIYTDWCKSISNTTTIDVTKNMGQIQFIFDTGRSVKTLKSGKEDTNDKELVYHQYYSEQFTRISKMSSFVSEPIEIRLEGEKPLYFLCKSPIGTMKIFMYKTKDE